MGQCRPVRAIVRRLFAAVTLIILAHVFALTAAPHHGERMMFDQPDRSRVPVILWGDEFHIDAESPDGYTLIRGDDGWICYAELSADGSEYVSTGVRYTGASRAAGTRKGLRIRGEAAREKRRRNKEVLGYDELIAETEFSKSFKPRTSRTLGKARSDGGVGHAPADDEVRRIVGLTLLIQFPDQPVSEITQTAVEEFCNREGGLGGTSAAGSVRDYFLEVSNGRLDYYNIVTPFVTVDNPRSYYDNGQTGYQRVPHLITDALKKLAELDFDISEVTTESSMPWGSTNERTTAVALNIFYAGSAPRDWATGIWPHSGTYRAPSGQQAVTIDGIRFGRYQMSNLGTRSNPPGIGTFVHENGHLIMRWPDLYPYSDAQVVPPTYVGSYCVMASSNGTNPQPPNPHFRAEAGWIDVTDVTDMDNVTLTHVSNGNTAYQFVRNSRESYYMEARQRTGRSAGLPGAGLVVWHVHTSGNNTNHGTVRYPMVAVVTADNRPFVSGNNGANAPFRAGGGSRNTEFSSTTTPAAIYHDGVLSGIRISEVSASGDAMTFKIGGGDGPRTYYLTVQNGTGTGYYEAGARVDIAAPDMAESGRGFFRWTGGDAEPNDAYAHETFVTMIAREVTLAPQYARMYALPGQIEADTAAILAGVASASNTASGATGNRVARIRTADTVQYAAYLVNAEAAGTYQMTYRILVNSTNAGTLYLLDFASGDTLDAIAVPTNRTAAMQTIEGKTVTLAEGRSVLRLAAAVGTSVSIDWIGAEFVEADVDSGDVAVVAGGALGLPQSYGIRAARNGSIVYSLPTAGRVSVRLYDIRGRMIASLGDGVKAPGVYNVNVAAAKRNLSRGMYIVRMKSGGYSQDIKFNYRK